MKSCVLLGCMWLWAATRALAQPTENKVIVTELQTYYERGTAPAWSAAIKNLATTKREERAAAAKYLVALLDQAQADEQSGKAPWRATPFWGSRGENPARNLRGGIVDDLAKSPASPATLTVIGWYLDHEKISRFQETAMAALGKVEGQEADEFYRKLLQPAHANSAVALAALQEIGKRKVALPEPAFKALCNHYRPGIRTAARKLNKERGGAEPGPFDGEMAMQRAEVAALMMSIGALLDQPAPPDAEFVKVTSKWTDGQETGSSTKVGWLVKNDGDAWVVLNLFGRRETFHKQQKIQNRRGGEETVVENRWEKSPIAEEVKRVAELRAKGDPEFGLSERGGLTGQFQGRGAGVYEVLLAHWLYTAKQFELSAQVFLPALDSLYNDEHLVEMIRHRVGAAVGYRMLVAFAGDRDFAETERLAKALVQRYPGTEFHHYAVKLSEEMPRRAADFKTLALPTPEAWAELKKKLSRAEQIAYLAERMRLLNCFQLAQPGGYSIRDVQYAEPCGMSDDAAWGLGRGVTKVINPCVELVGGAEGIFGNNEKQPFRGLELTVADIPRFVPFLRDDWHILCVSFWRDFSSDRHLATTRPIFASIINGLAERELCQIQVGMTAAEMEKHLKEIVRWADANAHKSKPDLLWEALEEKVKAGERFHDLPNVSELIELKDKRVGPVLLKYLNQFELTERKPNANEFKIEGVSVSTSNYCLEELLRACLRYDPAAFQEPTRRFASHKSATIRLLVGRILFAGGDAPEGRKLFARILENDDPRELEESLPELLEMLLKEGSDGSKQTARLIFKNKRYDEIREERVRAALVRQCAEAGIGDGYLSYLPLLEIKGNTIGGRSYSSDIVVGELIAKEIIKVLAPEDTEIARIQKDFPKAADQIKPLKEWLQAKAKAVAK